MRLMRWALVVWLFLVGSDPFLAGSGVIGLSSSQFAGSIHYNYYSYLNPDDLGKRSHYLELHLLKFLEMSLATLDLEGL